MRTLILTCNTGEGHNSCASAIQEYYAMQGAPCVIEDALAFVSPGASRFISSWHVRIYRHMPALFRVGYRYSEKHPAVFHERSCVYRLFARGSERLFQYIRAHEIHAVICTHVFAALMLTDLLKQHPMRLSTCFVATDYTCSPSTKDSRLDRYFIPDDALAADFECSAIPADRIEGCGIPVRQMFYRCMERADAKRARGLPPEHRHLLMMCGSMGCGPMTALAGALSDAMPPQYELTVVCGTNTALQRKLEKAHAGKPNIHIEGYVRDMSALMDSADLYLTKPGGISVSEAAQKRLPMVLIDAVAGCEAYNKLYYIRKGCARTGATVAELTEVCLTLLQDDARRQAMADCYPAPAQDCAAARIFACMEAAHHEIKEPPAHEIPNPGR